MKDPFAQFQQDAGATVINQQQRPILLARKRTVAPLTKILSGCAEFALFVVLYLFMGPAFSELGIGDDILISEDAVLGQLLGVTGDITAANLYAVLVATTFLAVPYVVWKRVLRPGGLFCGEFSDKIENAFLLLCLIVVFTGDILLVWFRVQGEIFNPINPNQMDHPLLAGFFGFFFLLINLAVSLFAAKSFPGDGENR